jgi:hypothetical protein
MLAVVGGAAGTPDALSDSFLGYNLLTTLFAAGAVVLIYFLLRELEATPGVLTVALILFMFCRTLHYYAVHVMTDVPFTFFAIGALILGLRTVKYQDRRGWVACVGAGLMILVASSVRPVGPLLLLAITGGLWFRGRLKDEWQGRLGKTAILWGFLVLPLIGYVLWTHGLSSGTQMGHDYFRGRLGPARLWTCLVRGVAQGHQHFGGLGDALAGSDLGTLPGILLAAVMGVGLVASLRQGERQASLFALLLMASIVAGGWALDRRYLLPAVPIMYYWLVLGARRTGRWLRHRWDWWTPARVRKLGGACLFVLLAVNVLRIGDVVIEQRGAFYTEIADGRLADYGPVFAWLRRHAASDQTVLVYEWQTVHYFTRLRTIGLPRRTAQEETEWKRGQLAAADYLIVDDERADSTGPLQQAAGPAGGILLEPVMTSGGVALLRVRRTASSGGSGPTVPAP